MNIKYLITLIGVVLLFNACDSKSTIDESLVASNNKKEISNKFESKVFKLKTLDDKLIELKTTLSGIDFKDYKNKKIILIDVFATWCPPCIKGIPDLNELQKKYKDDLVIISVLFEEDKSKEDVKKFVKEHGIEYIVTVGKENFNLAKELGEVTKVPEYYLYDKDGIYVKKFVGETSKEIFDSYIKNIKE